MSWSVSKQGTAEAVRKEIAADFEGITYLTGDEATLKDTAAGTVDAVLACTNPDKVVTVSASGHSDVEGDKQVKHTFNIAIT